MRNQTIELLLIGLLTAAAALLPTGVAHPRAAEHAPTQHRRPPPRTDA